MGRLSKDDGDGDGDGNEKKTQDPGALGLIKPQGANKREYGSLKYHLWPK